MRRRVGPRAAWLRREGEWPMSSTLSSRPSSPSTDATLVPADPKNDGPPIKGLSLGRRALLSIAFLIAFCIGVAATLAWQSYGNAAIEAIANSSPRLSWLAPPAAQIRSAPDTIAPATPAAPSPDQQQNEATSLDLAAVQQRVDKLTTSSEQIARSIDQLAAGQAQIARDIAILRDKRSAPQPPLAAAPVPRPAPRPSQASPVR